MNKTELAQKRLHAVKDHDEYYVHECFNGNELVREATYKVNHSDYVRWEDIWPLDCFNEIDRKRFEGGCWDHYVAEHHLFLNAGDCEDPAEVVTMHYDWTL